MKMTVGIAAYKEPRITKCLKAVLNEGLKNLEVIVACPDDETASLVKKFKTVKLIKEKRKQGKPAAVNKILKKASSDIIILTDADMIIRKGSLKRLVSHFKNESVGIVNGRPVVTNKRDSMLGFWGCLLYDLAHKRRLAGVAHVTTNLCAFRRGLVKRIPEESLVDDYVIGLECLRKGYKFVYEPRAVVSVTFPNNTSDFLKQRVRTFAGYMQIRDWYGESERSFSSEVRKGVKSVFSYPKNLKEWSWLALLFIYRLRAWISAYYLYRIKKKKLSEIWTPAESTKI